MKKTISIVMALMMVLACTSVFAFSGIGGEVTAPAGAEATANTIIGVIKWIGYAIAVGMLVYVGIKYIMASANDKAEIKNALIKYVLGAILIAGAPTIAEWVFAIMQ